MDDNTQQGDAAREVRDVEQVVVRFAGDSGDGMQLTGTEFTHEAALAGNDISTYPDFPAEIRAPAGTLAGVSGYQLHFSSDEIFTPGDEPDVLVAMNPAALKMNVRDLRPGGVLLVNSDNFGKANLNKAGYTANPLDDGSLAAWQVIQVAMSRNVAAALDGLGMSSKEIERCKNFYALGLMFWIYSRPVEREVESIQRRFRTRPQLADANVRAFKAGYAYGETTEIFASTYRVGPAPIQPGTYRSITGNEALVLGLVTAGCLADRTVVYGSYPITPASDILHLLSAHKNFDVVTVQAEDEIAAVGVAIGATYAGAIGVTATSGPGLALKGEAIGLAVMAELPLVVVDVQRAGPSTGMPTKTEQTDLNQALYGRSGESPVVVVAPATPSECFDVAIEAMRLAVEHMVPVILLSDAFLANGADRWLIPDVASLPRITVQNRTEATGFMPYLRDPETLVRPWALPGTPGLEHRIGGLEKEDGTGNVSYDPLNHERMTAIRAAKVARIAQHIPEASVAGDPEGDLLLVGWGGTYGALAQAARRLRAAGHRVGHLHLRYLNPLQRNVEALLGRYARVLVCELNSGQLRQLLRARFLVACEGLNKVQGRPFRISEVTAAAERLLPVRPRPERATAVAVAAS